MSYLNVLTLGVPGAAPAGETTQLPPIISLSVLLRQDEEATEGGGGALKFCQHSHVTHEREENTFLAQHDASTVFRQVHTLLTDQTSHQQSPGWPEVSSH